MRPPARPGRAGQGGGVRGAGLCAGGPTEARIARAGRLFEHVTAPQPDDGAPAMAKGRAATRKPAGPVNVGQPCRSATGGSRSEDEPPPGARAAAPIGASLGPCARRRTPKGLGDPPCRASRSVGPPSMRDGA